MFARYESDTGAWNEVLVKDNVLITRSGKAGKDGRRNEKEHKDHEAALKDAKKRIAALVKKERKPVMVAPVEETHPDLHDELLNAEDDAPFQVYADWALEQGLARGEFAALNRELSASAEDEGVQKKFDKHLKTHATALAPERFWKMCKKTRSKTRAEILYSSAEWRNGFLYRAHVAKLSDKPPYTVRELVHELLPHPSARYLRELSLGFLGESLTKYNYTDVLEAISLYAPISLRALHIGNDGGEQVLSSIELEGVGDLCAQLPQLRELSLRAGTLTLGALHAPLLQSLHIDTQLQATQLADIAASTFDGLRDLTLRCGGEAIPAAQLEELLGALAKLPLKSLRIERCKNAVEVLRGLTRHAPEFSALRTLSLAHSDLQDSHESALVGACEALSLEELDLRGNFLKQALSALPALGRLHSEDQRNPYALGFDVSAAAIERFAGGDEKSIIAARKLCKPSSWSSSGMTANAVWGVCRGSSGDYAVYFERDGGHSCNCPSPKSPCKHPIALMLMVQNGHAFPDQPMPPGHEDLAHESNYYSSWE